VYNTNAYGGFYVQVNILQIRDNKNAWQIVDVFASWEEAIQRLAEINSGGETYTLDGTALVEVYDVVDEEWGY